MSAAIGILAAWMVEALIASALLMALVLMVRAPLRRASGPQVAYALWMLPLLRLMLPPLPASWHAVAATPISRTGDTITVLVLPAGTGSTAPLAAAPPVSVSLAVVLAAIWAAGAAGFTGPEPLPPGRRSKKAAMPTMTMTRMM